MARFLGWPLARLWPIGPALSNSYVGLAVCYLLDDMLCVMRYSLDAICYYMLSLVFLVPLGSLVSLVPLMPFVPLVPLVP